VDARELKQALKELGWSQAFLADRVKMHPNSISKMVKRDEVSGPVEAYIQQMVRINHLKEI